MSSTEDPPPHVDMSPRLASQAHTPVTSRFTPPHGGLPSPLQRMLPAMQLTLVSILTGAGSFVYTSAISPARRVFALPIPPIWAALLGFVFATWVALTVRRRPGSWTARFWPLVLWALSAALVGYALSQTPSNKLSLLTASPWHGAWIDPVWQALVTALLAALVPLLLRLRHVPVNSPWIRRMGPAAFILVLPLPFGFRWLETWTSRESTRIINSEIERLATVGEAISDASGKPPKAINAVRLSQIDTRGGVNDRALWLAAEVVEQTARLRSARNEVAAIVAGVRSRIQCPTPPDPVKAPENLPKPTFGLYVVDDGIAEYLQKVEKNADDFRKAQEIALDGLRQVARLCSGLIPPKGLEKEPLICAMSEEDAMCPPLPAVSKGGERAALLAAEVVPGAAISPSLDPAFFQTLLGRNKKSQLTAGCYSVPRAPFDLLLYCNIYAPREKDDARVRLQTWVAFESKSPLTDGSLPSQLFVTISTTGGTGARIHGALFDNFKSKALPEEPGYDVNLCERGSCFIIPHGTQRIQVARIKNEESQGHLRLRARVLR